MKLEGMHHITMITGDARQNVEFYADVLGLRFVKKTVNFDAPDAYHLYFGDEAGSPGSILTWFEFAGARPGRPGAGMIHTIQPGVASVMPATSHRMTPARKEQIARQRSAASQRSATCPATSGATTPATPCVAQKKPATSGE